MGFFRGKVLGIRGGFGRTISWSRSCSGWLLSVGKWSSQDAASSQRERWVDSFRAGRRVMSRLPPYQFHGGLAVVTGGASGIGEQLAKHLAVRGATCISSTAMRRAWSH